MGLFDVLKPKQTEIDYEAAAKMAEAQTYPYNAAQMWVTSGGGGGAIGGAGSSGLAYTAAQQYIEPHTQTISDVGMIAMRMRSNSSGRVRQDAAYPRLFDFIATHRYTDDKVAVFVCNNGSYVVLEDNTDLFPSDALITQLRMIQK